MPPYQNYVMNAYLWLLIGVLFRLPHLAVDEHAVQRLTHMTNLRSASAYAGAV
jgi:hypothetical protein